MSEQPYGSEHLEATSSGVTAEYLRGVQFAVVKKRGLDPEQVGAVVLSAAQTVEQLASDLRAERDRRAAAERELLEVTGSTAAAHMLAAAEKTAHDVVAEAQAEADRLVEQARERIAEMDAAHVAAEDSYRAAREQWQTELESLEALHGNRLADMAAELEAARESTLASEAARREAAEAELAGLDGRLVERRAAVEAELAAFVSQADEVTAALEVRVEEFRAAARLEVSKVIDAMATSLETLSGVTGFDQVPAADVDMSDDAASDDVVSDDVASEDGVSEDVVSEDGVSGWSDVPSSWPEPQVGDLER